MTGPAASGFDMRYEEMFPDQFMEVLGKKPIAFVPLGLLEWHGQHLVYGFDAIKAHEICLRVAERTGGIVLPPIYWGVSGLDMVGTLQIELSTARELFISVFRQLLKQGFKAILALTGHYSREQVFVVEEAAEYCMRMHNVKGERVKISALPDYELVKDLGYMGDHGAKWETSIMMYLRPELVDLKRLEKLVGVIGDDPRAAASYRTGEMIVEQIVKRTSELVETMLKSVSK